VDYSHGVRLMSRRVIVDGLAVDAAAVLQSPELCALLGDDGPIDSDPYAPQTIKNP